MVLGVLDAASPHQHRLPEEALVSMPAPFVMALAGCLAALLSWTNVGSSDAQVNTRDHWTGIIACFVPLIWFSFWCGLGYAYPRQWFVRILD
jgi:hypothetical protein